MENKHVRDETKKEEQRKRASCSGDMGVCVVVVVVCVCGLSVVRPCLFFFPFSLSGVCFSLCFFSSSVFALVVVLLCVVCPMAARVGWRRTTGVRVQGCEVGSRQRLSDFLFSNLKIGSVLLNSSRFGK